MELGLFSSLGFSMAFETWGKGRNSALPGAYGPQSVELLDSIAS
jgi:hypothetical protein